MKSIILAVITALAFSGVARADDFNTFTVTGIITDGYDSGPNGTNDDASLFGSGDLLNAMVSVTVSYDATYVQNNFNYTNDGVGYSDTTLSGDPSPYQMSVTIGGISFSVTGTFNEDLFLCSASDSSCGSNFGGIAAEDSIANILQVYFFNSDSALAGYDVNNPSDVSAAFNDPDNTYNVFIANGPGGPDAYDDLMFSPSSEQPIPEPSSWLLLFTGLGGMVILRLRHGAVSR
jgi:hypothetical protein